MGVDYYIRSLSEPAQAKYMPLVYKVAIRRDKLFDDLVQQFCDNGLPSEEAEAKAKADNHYQHIKGHVQLLIEEWQSVENGYFRDPYNMHNLLSIFGLADLCLFIPREDESNLADIMRQVINGIKDGSRFAFFDKLLNDHHELIPNKSREFLTILREHEPTFYDRLDNFIEYFRSLTGIVLDPFEAAEWTQGFKERYREFRRFLKLAIELNEPVLVSY